VTSSDADKPVQTSHNIASEKAVLSGIMSYGKDAYVDVQYLIEEETFTLDKNKIIYKCLTKIMETADKVDLTSVLSAAKQLDLDEYVEKQDVLNHVKHLMRYQIELDNVRGHASKIRKLQFVRETQEGLRDIYRALCEVDGDERVSAILEISESKIREISQKYVEEDRSAPKILGTDILQYVEHLKENEISDPGLGTCYPTFDQAIGGGLRRGCVDLVGGRSKSGKSLLADNVALHLTRDNIPVLMLDTEMTTEDHWNRLLANISGEQINDISSSKFTEELEKEKSVENAAKELENLPFHYLNVSGKPFEEILSIARRWLLKEVGYDENGRMKDCLIIYDYLKLMSASDVGNNMAEFQALGFQITQLHNFCVEYDCPCLSFVQLNRDGMTKETEDAVSGSDRLIWLCTSFSIFKKKTEEEIAMDGVHAGNRKLIPVVSRHGPGMDDGYICMNMTGALARIEELGTIREVQQQRQEQNGFPDADSDTEAASGQSN
jgi:replicative DNA helicase